MGSIPVNESSAEKQPASISKGRTVNQASPATPVKASAGLIVLQWLTYTFWGWLAVSLVWLAGVVTSHYLESARPEESFIPFLIASVVVLAPVAYLGDRAYRRRESLKKSGIEVIMMVVYAVIFMLISVGALIFTAYSAVNMMIDVTGDIKAQFAAIITSLTAAVLFGLAFARVLRPAKYPKLPAVVGLTMLAASVVLLSLTLAGPVAKLVALRDDRLIESSLPSVQLAVNSYVQENNKLPSQLSEVEPDNDGARKLIKDGSVKYLPESGSYRYQLCVNYLEALNPDWADGMIVDDGFYQVDTSYHAKGEVCYRLDASRHQVGIEDGPAVQPQPVDEGSKPDPDKASSDSRQSEPGSDSPVRSD